jgi:hypothetical protein
MSFTKPSSPSAHTWGAMPGKLWVMKRLLALGALALTLSGCIVQGDVFTANNLATPKDPCNASGELILSFDYVGEFNKLSFGFTPNGQTTPTVINITPDVLTPGFRNFGTASNKYQMAIKLTEVTSSPEVATQAVTVTPKIPEPTPLTIYPMDITLKIFKGTSSIDLSLNSVNVGKCFGK